MRKQHIRSAVNIFNRTKKITVSIVIILLMTAAAHAETDRNIKKEITAVLDTLAASYKNQDVHGIMSLYSTSPNSIAIGAGKEQIFIGLEQIKASYEQAFTGTQEIRAAEYKLISVGSSGTVAWAAADAFVSIGTEKKTTQISGRFSAVLEEVQGKWLFVQTHFSILGEESEEHPKESKKPEEKQG